MVVMSNHSKRKENPDDALSVSDYLSISGRSSSTSVIEQVKEDEIKVSV
jgi:hypothetical protein